MKIKTVFLFAVVAFSALWLTSCLNGDNSQTLMNAYGYVMQDNSLKTYVNTSGGSSITWNGISSELSAGQCVKLSYTVDGSSLNGYYNATEHNIIQQLSTFNLTNGTPISVNDSNFVTSTIVTQYHYTEWYGDNWFLALNTKTYPGLGITPKFYYSTSVPTANFDVSKDSVIVDIRLSVSGKPSSTTTPEVKLVECAVDLTPVRTIFSAFTGKAIPIYFRYYPTVSSKATTAKTVIYIPTPDSAS
jgi:hypothetical protein